MNGAKVIANLKEQGLEYVIAYKNDYPAVVDHIRVKIDGSFVLYEDKYYVKNKKEWVEDFYRSCDTLPPRTYTDYPAERVLHKIVEELYEMRNKA
jgi:hypothetical protein